MSGYEYIRSHYGVTPVPGHDVQHTITGGFGVIRPEGPSHLHYVKVLFHGDKHAVNCHPTELVYLGCQPHDDSGASAGFGIFEIEEL